MLQHLSNSIAHILNRVWALLTNININTYTMNHIQSIPDEWSEEEFMEFAALDAAFPLN